MGGCCSAEAIDADEALATLQAEAPELVIDGEDFLFAFAFMRDQVYFTNLRILVKDKQGMFGSSIAWKTIPYSAIKAFFVETAGALDSDVELGLWPSGWSGGDFSEERMMPSPCYTLSFKKDAVDLFALQRLLNGKIFNPSSTDAVEVVPPPEEDAGTMSKMMDMLGGDARAIDPTVVQEQLRADPPVLLPDEVVDMAFKCGRDTYALTSSRMLVIDVKGMTGKCVRYTSYLWSCIKAFAVQTPGAFLDRDCELKLWNGIAHVEENLFAMDLRDSGTDIMGVQRYLTDRILGQDEAPPSAEANGEGTAESTLGTIMEWFTGDSRQIDADEADRMFHEDVRLLQGSETVEMAFKAARDTILFTTKRLVVIDVKGLTGSQIEYKSIPWGCVQAFALQSAAALFDLDSELKLWTDIYHTYERVEEEAENPDDEPKVTFVPTAGPVSYIAIDFQKDKVDLSAVGRYLASRCARLGSQTSMPQVAYGGMPPGEPGLLEGFVSWLGDDYRMCDPLELDAKLRDDAAMLLPEEAVQMGFVCGRDAVVFTTHRAIQIDTQWLGSKVLYLSLPWTAIKTYKVQSAGTWDLDAEMKLGIYAPWYNQDVGPGLTIDFSRGRCDILAVNTFLSCQTVGAADGTSTIAREVLPPCPEGPIGELFSWLGDDFHQIPAAAATGKFKSAPAILLADEAVELAFKCGRDFYMATTKRWIKVDAQREDGGKVSFESVPFASVPCYAVTTAASNPFDQDAEIGLLTIVGGWGFDVKKEQGDIMSVYTIMNRKVVLNGASLPVAAAMEVEVEQI